MTLLMLVAVIFLIVALIIVVVRRRWIEWDSGALILAAAFCKLAKHIIDTLPGSAERTVSLRKLLEAKDAAVRASLPQL